jgi:hypothetical protein
VPAGARGEPVEGREHKDDSNVLSVGKPSFHGRYEDGRVVLGVDLAVGFEADDSVGEGRGSGS